MIRRRHSSSTASTTVSASRSLASVSRSRVKFVPTAAASPATSRAARSPARSACAAPPRGRRPAAGAPGSAVLRTASMTYSGKPPVVAWSRSASASGRGCPEIASASCAVSAASSGPRESSVSSPVARIRTVQSAELGILVEAVVAQRRRPPGAGVPAASRRQKVRKASVSWSHHCMLSSTSSIGRPTASSARARPSKKRWRCQASTIALGPAPRPPRLSAGTSLPTSARQAGSRRRGRRLDRGVAQPVRHRRQRKPPRRPEALGARNHGALQPRHRGDLGHQAGLADAGAAADQREAGAAAGRGPPQRPGAG